MEKKYTLLHKDLPVLNFSVEGDFIKLKVDEIFNEKFIPIGIFSKDKNDNTIINDEHFTVWWKNRTIPSGRKNLEKAFEILGISSKSELLEKTHSLNLTDHYWVKKERDLISWKKINYFENGFDNSIGEYLLLKRERTFSENSLNSPDLFTDGLLPKRWILKDNEIFLLKGTDSTFQQEPFNEVLATLVCEKLGISHASYKISVLDNNGEKEYFSVCKNFVDINTEFVSAYDVVETFKKLNNESYYQHFIRCSELLGIENFEKELHRMFALDFLMANTDRHLHNFGFLRNADTLDWIGLAPIFDTEKSMFLKKVMPKTSYPSIDIEAKPFKDNQAEMFNLLNKDFLKDLNFENLSNISEHFSKLLENNVYISEERRKALCCNLENRIKSISYMISNDKKFPITKNKHKRELDRFQSLMIVPFDATFFS